MAFVYQNRMHFALFPLSMVVFLVQSGRIGLTAYADSAQEFTGCLLMADIRARTRLSPGEQLCCQIFISSSCCLGMLSSHSKGSAVDVFSYLFHTHLSTAA